jgi:endonuclease-3
MATPSKTQLLTEVYTLLKRHYKLESRDPRLSVLEAVIYGICHEGTTREQANQAMSRFKDDFYDWNEVRVSGLEEIQGVLAGLPDPELRAFRLRRFLRQLFEKTYAFTLDGLTKKPLKDAVKSLHEFEALQSDFVLATVIQLALGGHGIPVDEPMRRGLERLGIASPNVDLATLRATLERAIPKNRGIEFVDLIEELTHDTCVEDEPDCPRCELRKVCPTGQSRLSAEKAAARAAAAKPKPSKTKPAGDGKPGKKPAAPPTKAKPSPKGPKAQASKGKPRRAK